MLFSSNRSFTNFHMKFKTQFLRPFFVLNSMYFSIWFASLHVRKKKSFLAFSVLVSGSLNNSFVLPFSEFCFSIGKKLSSSVSFDKSRMSFSCMNIGSGIMLRRLSWFGYGMTFCPRIHLTTFFWNFSSCCSSPRLGFVHAEPYKSTGKISDL